MNKETYSVWLTVSIKHIIETKTFKLQYPKCINNNDPNKHKLKSKGERTVTHSSCPAAIRIVIQVSSKEKGLYKIKDWYLSIITQSDKKSKSRR